MRTNGRKRDEHDHGVMIWRRGIGWLEFVVIFFLVVQGCGGTFYTSTDQGRVSGTWDLSLTQAGASVRGTKLLITQDKRFDPFSGTTSDNAKLTGIFDGNNVVIALQNADGTTTTLTGGASNEWNTLSGQYASTGSNGSGTWRADKEVAAAPTPTPTPSPTPTPTPTPTPAPEISVKPSTVLLSCSLGQSAVFVVTGGNQASYRVTATSNGSLVTLATDTLTTNGQFTVTALTTCSGTNGAIVSLVVTDNSASTTVPVIISNP